MAIAVRQWLKGSWHGTRSKKNRPLVKARYLFEHLEPRMLLSGSSVVDETSAVNLLTELSQVATVTSEAVTDTTYLTTDAASTLTASSLAAAPLDTIVFGSTTSETNHAFSQNSSQVITGGLSQTARQLLPLSTVAVNGGDMTFTMTVDPVKRNYFTIKLWGSDDTDSGKGRLYLYIPVDGVNYQVGYRHEGDYAPLSVTASKQPLPGQFFYSTTLLPLSMTQGKTSITLTIISTGELYGLGSGGPPSGNYQFNMDTPSRGIYRAYTHTDPLLDVSGETQGTAPTTTTLTTPTESSVLGPTGTYTTGINSWVSGRLTAAITTFNTEQVAILAQAYSVSQLSNGYQNANIVSKVIAVIDGFATDYYASPYVSPTSTGNAVTGADNYGAAGGNEVWGGRFGPLGWAIHLLLPQLQSSLDTVVNYGTGGNITRRQAWGDMLLGSRDYGRFSRDSRYLTNQSLIADENIYKANRGLLDLGNANAFTENNAQRYLKESIGLLPWLGSDLVGGGSSLKYGSNYYQVTEDGLTREWGYAGGYSEMQVYAANFYDWTGNVDFKNQAIKMEKAIAYMRTPAIDVVGSNYYRSMERVGLLAWRGVREADGYFSDEIAYGDQGPWSNGMRVAGVTLDPYAIGYAKQMLADGQYLSQLIADPRYYFASGTVNLDYRFALYAWNDYNAVKNSTDSGIRLPMTDGQPDFAWADEQDGIVVIKHGTDRLWIEPYWQAKDGTGVNGIGRFEYDNGQYVQYGVLETDPQFTYSGSYYVRPNMIDNPITTAFTPPDNPSNAYAGELLPIAANPGDAREDSPYRGKANFYALRFGHYLIGINTTSDTSYELKTPVGFTSAEDLVSGETLSGTITVGPNSTVVLYLSDSYDAAPVPTAPLLLLASATSSHVSLQWTASSGAATYNVKRALASGGAYTTIATGLTGTTFVDSTVSSGTAYLYVVSASNANGESYNSMVESVSTGLPSSWYSQDIGTVTTAGSTNYIASELIVHGSGSNVGGTADSLQFAYRSVTGDCTIIARLACETLGTTTTILDDKVGLMMRSSTDAGAQNVFVFLDSKYNAARWQMRTTINGSTSAGTDLTNMVMPIWFKLQRVGNVFTGYISSDGLTWTFVGTSTISMSNSIYVGVAVCSRDQLYLNTSTFDNVTINGAAIDSAPTVAKAASATPNPVYLPTTTSTLSVQGNDNGGEANLIYTWSATGPAAVNFSVNGTHDAKNTIATFSKAGSYSFQVTITDHFAQSVTSSIAVNVYSTIAGRYIFYNNSKFDGTSDSAAIATDKAALLPGQKATFANYTSYSLGINGIIVDIKGLANPGALDAADFQFKVGNGGSWTTAPAPSSISAPGGGGAGGSDRVTIIWTDDNAIKDKWLQITVLADADTGLGSADVFYFGNAIGESDDNSANAVVDSQDEIGSRTHKTGFSAAAIDNHYDYNRDGKVNATDDLIARHNRTDGVGADPLQLITAPASSSTASGDALQTLSVVVDETSQQATLSEDKETSQSATLSAEIATSQSVSSSEDNATSLLASAAEESATSQLVTLSEDNETSQPVTLSAEIATSRLEISPAAAEIAPASTASAPVQAALDNQVSQASLGGEDLNVPAVVKFSSSEGSTVRDSSLAILSDGIQVLSISLGPAAPLQSITLRPTTSEGLASPFPRRSYESHNYPGSAQYRLHDAVFARSIARFSLTEEDFLPEDSSAPADIDTILNGCPSFKSDKSLRHAIDTVLSAARHKQE